MKLTTLFIFYQVPCYDVYIYFLENNSQSLRWSKCLSFPLGIGQPPEINSTMLVWYMEIRINQIYTQYRCFNNSPAHHTPVCIVYTNNFQQVHSTVYAVVTFISHISLTRCVSSFSVLLMTNKHPCTTNISSYTKQTSQSASW